MGACIASLKHWRTEEGAFEQLVLPPEIGDNLDTAHLPS
jgi:hypothetical protein